jgi:hypothetical protein
MTNFDDREKGFERKFVHDSEIEFNIKAKRDKLIANWVSKILDYNDEQKNNYLKKVIHNEVEQHSDEDLFKIIKKDLEDKNIQDQEIRQKMAEFLAIAKTEV